MRNKTVGRSIASAIAMLALASTASANDGKVYPAAFCAGALVGNPPIVSFSVDGVTNTSTANSAVLACPAIKDNANSTLGLSEALLRYCKSDTTGFLATLYSYDASGTSNYQQSRSDFSWGGCKAMSFTGVSSYANGFYGLIVVIPPSASGATYKSKLISYRLTERE